MVNVNEDENFTIICILKLDMYEDSSTPSRS